MHQVNKHLSSKPLTGHEELNNTNSVDNVVVGITHYTKVLNIPLRISERAFFLCSLTLHQIY